MVRYFSPVLSVRKIHNIMYLTFRHDLPLFKCHGNCHDNNNVNGYTGKCQFSVRTDLLGFASFYKFAA